MFILYRAKDWTIEGIFSRWEDAKALHDAMVATEGRRFYIKHED